MIIEQETKLNDVALSNYLKRWIENGEKIGYCEDEIQCISVQIVYDYELITFFYITEQLFIFVIKYETFDPEGKHASTKYEVRYTNDFKLIN